MYITGCSDQVMTRSPIMGNNAFLYAFRNRHAATLRV